MARRRVAKRSATTWASLLTRQVSTLTRMTMRVSADAVKQAAEPLRERRTAPVGAGDWLSGIAFGATGPRRYRLFRPAGVRFGERLPLLVMLHGCGQDAKGFAASTRMNKIAARERFLVLYPEQDRMANAQGCWNWFDVKAGRAQREAASIIAAVDNICLLYAADRDRVAVAGLSSGASMAALLATRYPSRFKAVTMHSGIPPGTADSTMSAVGAMHGFRSTSALPAKPGGLPASWPPMLVIHGTDDTVVSVSNGRAAAHVWAEAFGAHAGDERALRRGNRYPMQVTDFKHRGATKAKLIEITHLGHAWSGGAADEKFSDGAGPDASRMVWRFVSQHFAPVD